MEIVERDVTLECALPPVVRAGQNQTCGFPKPPSLQEKASDRAVRSRVSLFAHHYRLTRSRNGTANPTLQRSDGSCMVDGSGLGSTAEAARIHRENQLTLSGMTQLQIRESRQQLIDSLQPQLVDFVRRRRLQQSMSCWPGGAGSSSSRPEPSIVENPDGDMSDGDSLRYTGTERLTAVSASGLPSKPDPVAMVTGMSSTSVDDVDGAFIDVDAGSIDGVNVAPVDGIDAVSIGDRSAALTVGVEAAAIGGVDAVSIDGVDAAPIDGVDAAPIDGTSTATLDELRHQLPIDVEEAARRWPRMDRVEVEKLRWMTQLPAPQPAQSDTGLPARFHFDGDLLSVSVDFPCESALYHHGQEPERAGYTVDEMFVLIRSSVQQQRIVGLQIITNLLMKTKLGAFDSCFSPPLLLQLLDSGLLLLLRFSMDDRSPAVVSAAVLALCALVHNRPDEVCLDRVFGWPRGRIQPSLPSCLDPVQCEQFSEERHQLKDDHVARLDAIRALVRTDTLLRIRYILEVLRPSAAAVIGCLQLLTTFCRHSEQLAAELLDCPRLLDVLINEFLPPTQLFLSSSDDGCVYGVALHQLLKLLRVLCSQSRQLADELLARHSDLMCRVMTYTSIDPSDSGLPVSESLTLAIESYRLWTVLLSYNIADSHFIDFYPLLMRQLHYYAGCVSVYASSTEYRFSHDLGTCVLNLCTTAVHAAGTQQPSKSHRESEIGWHHVTGLVDPVVTCLRKWMTELRTSSDPPTDSGHQLLASALCFLAAFHQLNVSEDRQLRQQHISTLCLDTLLPSIQSAALQRLLYVLPQHSALLSVPVALVTARRDPNSLRSLTWGHTLSVTSLQPGTPLPLLTGLVRLLSVASDICPSAAKQACAELLSSSCLLSYLRQLYSCEQLQLGSWFSRYELYLVTDLILVAAAQYRGDDISDDASIFYRCAVSLLASIPAGDEHLAHRMLHDVIFSPHLLPPGSVPVSFPRCAILYGECLWSPDVLYKSRVHGDLVTCAVTSLTRSDPEHSCVPLDWWYAPLVHLYQVHNACESAESGPQKRSLPGPRLFSPTETILTCIRTLLTLHEHSPASLHSVSRTANLSRLCCVFLAGDDLFLDDDVRSTLSAALRLVVGLEFDEQQKMPLDLNQSVPGLTSFHELYTQLLEQFEAVSFGDWLFGSVILLILHPRFPVQLRRTLVLEKPHALRSITTSVQQMLEPLGDFVGCRETDIDIISAYKRALHNDLIVEKRNPALFQIATLMIQ